ncbi:MAG: endonuclease domain-containing protein [Parvibaculum sp.]
MADEQARWLRNNQTEMEKILWRELRGLRSSGFHFRRQAPLGRYVVDFVCHGSKLIIEVDGEQHGETDAMRRDEQRSAWLEGEGFKVIRFWNNDVNENLQGVMQSIAMHLGMRVD